MQNNDHLVHARRLRANILAAPDVWLPRREILVDWLDHFLKRAGRATYELGATEAADLRALDDYLRHQQVPVV